MNNYEYETKTTKKYKRDYKYIEKDASGKYDMEKLEYFIEILKQGKPLPKEAKDHKLSGKYTKNNERECHLGPDFLLRYSIDKKSGILYLISTGDHRRVLGIEAFDMIKSYYDL